MPKNCRKLIHNQVGAINYLILFAALGVIAFLLISNIFNFRNKLFGNLYPKSTPAAATQLALINTMSNLDDLKGWQFFVDNGGASVKYSFTQNNISPSLDGNSAKFSLLGGNPYSGVQAYYFPTRDDNAVNFDTTWNYYLPQTTYNNEGSPSTIQSIEFSTMKWLNNQRWEWSLGWQNVPQTASQGGYMWVVWDGAHWIPTNIQEKLFLQQWNTLEVKGYIDSSGNSHYTSFISNGRVYNLSQYSYAPINLTGTPQLEVAMQLNGNYQTDPYSVYYDNIKFSWSDSLNSSIPTPLPISQPTPFNICIYLPPGVFGCP